MTEQARKADAYRKIALGGLVIKAGLGDQDKALLLGILLDAAHRITDAAEAKRLHALGEAAFKDHRHDQRGTERLGR